MERSLSLRRLPWWPREWSASWLTAQVKAMLCTLEEGDGDNSLLHRRCCISTVLASCHLEQTLPPTLQDDDPHVAQHLQAVYEAAMALHCPDLDDADDDDDDDADTHMSPLERHLLLSPPLCSWVGDPKEPTICHLAQLEQHLKALLYLCVVCKGCPLTSHMVKRAHYILMQGACDPEDGHAPAPGGQYRDHGSCLGTGLVFPDPISIPDSMEDVLARYRSCSDNMHYLHRCAFLFYHVVSIHPFSDGNGRLCRLLVDYCLVSTQGFPFPIPVAGASRRTRKHFFHVIEHAAKTKGTDLSLLSAYFLECVYHRLASLSDPDPHQS